jgi:hypothetical protein
LLSLLLSTGSLSHHQSGNFHSFSPKPHLSQFNSSFISSPLLLPIFLLFLNTLLRSNLIRISCPLFVMWARL